MEAEWSEDKEKRLQYVQRELHESQKRWSDGQELWVEEVGALSALFFERGHLNVKTL